MYLKQLEWAKWAAVDEMHRAQSLSAASSLSSIVAPVTPPREPLDLTTVPPVTPHRHVAKSVAAAKAIATPGQPRKTPGGKRALEPDEDEDVLGVLVPPVRKSPRTASATTRIPTSDRTLRPSRSTTNGTKAEKKGTVIPHKIPRPVTATSGIGKSSAPATRRRLAPGSPVGSAPSRLPTLKRPTSALTSTMPHLRSQVPPAPDAWMNKDTSAVVVPGSKSERPLLRSVRRRRSSFSAADVVA
jgi:cell division cycle 14